MELMLIECRKIVDEENRKKSNCKNVEVNNNEEMTVRIIENSNFSDDSAFEDTQNTVGASVVDGVLEECHKKHLVSKLKNFFEKNISKLNRAIEPIKIKNRKSCENNNCKDYLEETKTIRFRNRIRKGHVVDDVNDVEDILNEQRFSRRFSQYSISEYLDEKEARRSVSISSLLIGEHPTKADNISGSFDDLELKSSTPTSPLSRVSFKSMEPTDSGRGSVDTFERIFGEQTFSRGCSEYSITDLLDDDYNAYQ